MLTVEESAAVSVVIDLPFLLQVDVTIREKQTELVPLVITKYENTIFCPQEVISFSISLIKIYGYEHARRAVTTICRLHDFWWLEGRPILSDGNAADSLVWAYIAERIATNPDVNKRRIIHWVPIGWEALLTEFDHIRSYSRFCKKYKGALTAMGLALQAGSEIFAQATDIRLHNERFFTHLNAAVKRWKKLQDFEADLPSELRRIAHRNLKPPGKRSVTARLPEILKMIDAEKNITFKAIWLLLAGTGARISEILNLWTCDVLPGHHAKYFSNIISMNEPFVIFAEPRNSTYVGKTEYIGGSVSRRAYLDSHYKLRPRTDTLTKSKKAGNKGREIFNKTWQISWAYWLNSELAARFSQTLPALFALQARTNSALRHPYLLINSVNEQFRGDMTTKKNVQRACEAAWRRIGLKPGRSMGRDLHGFRHSYKAHAKRELKLKESIIQTMLGHTSPASQSDYGRDVDATYEALTASSRSKTQC